MNLQNTNFTKSKNLFFLVLASLFFFPVASIEAQNVKETTDRILNEQARQFNLTNSDLADWVITDEYVSKQSQIHHIYVGNVMKALKYSVPISIFI